MRTLSLKLSLFLAHLSSAFLQRRAVGFNECFYLLISFVFKDVAEAEGLVFFAKEAMKNADSLRKEIDSLQGRCNKVNVPLVSFAAYPLLGLPGCVRD